MPLRYAFLAMDVSDELLVMEALNLSVYTHTGADFFLSLPWRVYERCRKGLEEALKKNERD